MPRLRSPQFIPDEIKERLNDSAWRRVPNLKTLADQVISAGEIEREPLTTPIGYIHQVMLEFAELLLTLLDQKINLLFQQPQLVPLIAVSWLQLSPRAKSTPVS